ncbi:hypothetical protein O3M35_005166 [Rhynocoris fuscipes]|uniref:Uncharacterized protein n=1 Tax=Rhynocoris fuscipes TaxID=488301 RepID=A0AAW1DJX6_9HEMI
MLIGLSVRGAAELEKSGDIHRTNIKVIILYEWEAISQYSIYKFFSKYNLLFLMGILKPNLAQALEIPLVVYPFETPVKDFDIYRLKNIAIKQENVPAINLKFLGENLGYRGSQVQIKIK